jgi:hypothetical protein
MTEAPGLVDAVGDLLFVTEIHGDLLSATC